MTVETGIATTELVQLLTPEGERIEHPDYPLDLTTDDIKALYRDLVLVRRIDTEAIALQRQNELIAARSREARSRTDVAEAKANLDRATGATIQSQGINVSF